MCVTLKKKNNNDLINNKNVKVWWFLLNMTLSKMYYFFFLASNTKKYKSVSAQVNADNKYSSDQEDRWALEPVVTGERAEQYVTSGREDSTSTRAETLTLGRILPRWAITDSVVHMPHTDNHRQHHASLYHCYQWLTPHQNYIFHYASKVLSACSKISSKTSSSYYASKILLASF